MVVVVIYYLKRCLGHKGKPLTVTRRMMCASFLGGPAVKLKCVQFCSNFLLRIVVAIPAECCGNSALNDQSVVCIK